MQEICFVTNSGRKYYEVRDILKDKFEVEWEKELNIPEIQDTSSYVIARQKAEDAYEILKKPVLVEDTALCIHAWQTLPGALIKWFLKDVGVNGILKMLTAYRNLNASVYTTLAYCDESGVQWFHGHLYGRIVDEKPRGKNGFGFDSIFIPREYKKTLAEMAPEEKNKISHRRKALDDLVENIKLGGAQ